MDLIDYYNQHWTELPEGDVDWDRLQMIVSRVQPGDLVLEAGCGPGFLAKLLKDRGARVIGTDVSHVGVRRTAARGIETHQVDLDTMRLPFPDQHFDTVVCNSNLWLLFGRWPYIPNSPTDPYHIRHLTAYELRRQCERNGVKVLETRGHAGLWCKGLYPRWFSRRGIGRLVGIVYPQLVRLRPSFFARYLLVRGTKVDHKAGLVGLSDGHATPKTGAAA